MTNLNEIVYSAVKLTAASKKVLIEHVPNTFDKVLCEHITLGFGQNVLAEHVMNVGKSVDVHINKIVYNNDLCCCIVDNLWDLYPMNPIQHITMSLNGKTKPVESNKLLEKFVGDNKVAQFKNVDIVLLGVVNLYLNGGKWYLPD